MTPRIRFGSPQRRAAARDDDGAILVVWAVALVAIAGLVAMAVDLGNIAQTKQHTVNAAQAAALAAVVDLAPLSQMGVTASDAATAETTAVTDAEIYLHENYAALPTSGDAAYSTCGTVSGLYYASSESCVGFFNTADSSKNQSAPNGIEVAVPIVSTSPGQDNTVHYTFGKVAGLSTQSVSSTAFASLQTAASGYLLPFGYLDPAGGGAAGLSCLKDSTPHATTCPGFGPGSGQFGPINNPRYTFFTGAPPDSTRNSNNPFFETNSDLGIDHPLGVYGGECVYDWHKTTGSPCSTTDYGTGLTGDVVNGGTGFSTTELTGPVFAGGVGTPDGACSLYPRLAHPDGFTANSKCAADNVDGPFLPVSAVLGDPADTFQSGQCDGSDCSLNGVSIMEYLLPNYNSTGQAYDYNSVPGSMCQNDRPGINSPGSAPTAIDFPTASAPTWSAWDACVSSYMTSSPAIAPIFSSDIVRSPRFGVVPILGPSLENQTHEVLGFEGVYLDLGYQKSGTSQVGALGAWIFPLTWIEDSSSTVGSGGGVGEDVGGPLVANLCAYEINC